MADLRDYLPLFQETPESIRGRLDADANADLEIDDPRYIDLREGGFYYDITQVAVLEFARIWDALSVEVPASAFVLYAWGVYLDYHAGVFNLERKAAVAAAGEATFTGDEDVEVVTGTVISADAPTDEGETIEFITTEDGTTGTQVLAPGTVTPTPSGSGGSLGTATYYYVVSAVNEFGETTSSPEASAIVTGPSGSVALDWADVTGADGYRVYRGTVSGGPYQRIGSPATSDLDDLGNAGTVFGPPDLNSTAGVTIPIVAVETGSQGNLAAGAITNLDTVNVGIETVTNGDTTTSGADIEDDDSLRERILFQFEGRGAGNQNDYRAWALAYPGVGEAYVEPVWAGPGTVLVVVMDGNGDAVATPVVDGLQAELDPTPGTGDGLAPIGVTVTVATPEIVDIEVSATVTFETGYSLDGTGGLIATRSQIEDALRAYIDKLVVGDDVIYDHVKAQFYSVPGVHLVTSVEVNAGTIDVLISTSPAQVAQLSAATLS